MARDDANEAYEEDIDFAMSISEQEFED